MRLLLNTVRFFLFLPLCIFAAIADFDCVVVGTSPISLLHALYEFHSGRSVLILEKTSDCGGAWKSIEVCGIPHVDMGCHDVGLNESVANFLEEYVGCKTVALRNPDVPFPGIKGSNRQQFYPSEGCYEIIDRLLNLIERTDIILLKNHKLESAYFDVNRNIVEMKTAEGKITTHKLVLTSGCSVQLENALGTPLTTATGRSKYYHLYLLVEDPTPIHFTCFRGGIPGVVRATNLSHFSGLIETGQQLVVIQTQNENQLNDEQRFFDLLVKNGSFDSSAKLLKVEKYIYEQTHLDASAWNQISSQNPSAVEILNTRAINNIELYMEKWKAVLPKTPPLLSL